MRLEKIYNIKIHKVWVCAALIGCLSFCLNITSRAQNVSNLWDKQWVIDYDATITALSQAEKDHLDTMSVNIKNAIQNSLVGRQLFFGRNGLFQMSLANGSTFEGRWAQLENPLDVEIALNSGYIFRQSIESVTATQLTLKIEREDNSNVLINVWHFKLISE